MPERQRRTWDKVIDVLRKMRDDGASIKDASRESEISPRTAKRWLGSTLKKNRRGRLRPKTGDSFLRPLRVLTTDGPRELLVVGSKRASQISRHWIAVHHLLDASDLHALENFKSVSIVDANGDEFRLLALRPEVKRYGAAGVLSFESIYTRNS